MKYGPIPSSWKIVSVTIAPPSSTPKLSAATVTTGISALRNAWLHASPAAR